MFVVVRFIAHPDAQFIALLQTGRLQQPIGADIDSATSDMGETIRAAL